MMTKILVIAFVIFGIIACSKNSYNTKPTLKIKDMNGNVFNIGDVLTLQLEVTDKEGDVTDSLFVKKVRLNIKPASLKADSFYYKVPDAPNSTDGVIQLQFDHETLKAAISELENDTIAYRFALRDKAGNVSDTITTDPIVVIR